MSVDGLAALQAKRDLATGSRPSSRHLPPARNAPKKTPTTPETPSSTHAKVKPGPGASTHPEPDPADAAGRSPEKDELIRATIYLLSTDDDWFDSIARAAKTRRPRVDASRSAVARLALARLREALTSEEIVNILQSRAQNSNQTSGRKRL